METIEEYRDVANRMSERFGYLIEKLVKLRDSWKAMEGHAGEDIWGDCATDLDELIDETEHEK